VLRLIRKVRPCVCLLLHVISFYRPMPVAGPRPLVACPPHATRDCGPIVASFALPSRHALPSGRWPGGAFDTCVLALGAFRISFVNQKTFSSRAL